MIHIKKAKGKGYYVSVTAANGEILAISEVLAAKHNALKNIAAMALQFDCKGGIVTKDETTGQMYLVNKKGKKTKF